jgi:phosphohistidine phosphatase
MMELFLVRHGEAKSAFEDPRCPLSVRGVELVHRLADWTARNGVNVAQIRHSGLTRAEQTAALLGERLNPARGVIAVDGLGPDDPADALAATLGHEEAPIMLVSHQPFLPRLAQLLQAGSPEPVAIGFRPAEMACLVSREGGWSVQWVRPPDVLEGLS